MLSFVQQPKKIDEFMACVHKGNFTQAMDCLEQKVEPEAKDPIMDFDKRLKQLNSLFYNGLHVNDYKQNWLQFLKLLFQNKKFHYLAFDLIINNFTRQLNDTIKFDLIEFVFTHGNPVEKKNLLEELLGTVTYILNEDLVNIIAKNPILFEMAAEVGIQKFRLDFLVEMEKQFPQKFAMLKLKDKSGLTEESREWLNSFAALNEQQRDELQDRMKEFVNGFGNVSYQGGLLVCAETRARKKDYEFNPTVLKMGEFQKYLDILKDLPKPQRHRFVISGGHWISGDIKIDEKGHASILIIDSMGPELKLSAGREAIKTFAKTFPPEKSTIYLANEERQSGYKGCSIFSLDDVRHLYTAERYLPEKYKETGLFGYMEDKAVKSEIASDSGGKIPILLHHLPLSLERTMQSRKLKTIIEARPEEEKTIPVKKGKEGKPGEIAAVSAAEHFKEVPILTEQLEQKSKMQNKRLDYILYKFARKIYAFLRRNSEESIEQQTQFFTFKAFRERAKLLLSKVPQADTKGIHTALKEQQFQQEVKSGLQTSPPAIQPNNAEPVLDNKTQSATKDVSTPIAANQPPKSQGLTKGRG